MFRHLAREERSAFMRRSQALWTTVRAEGSMLGRFLNAADTARAENVLRRLQKHSISGWALTGGFAIELQILRSGGHCHPRPLHDIDFIVSAFDYIPETLNADFLFRHVHPDDPPGKTLLQAVEPEQAVRVDVFRAYGSEMNRLCSIELGGFCLKLVSLPDLAARHARLCWDLVDSKQVPCKYVQDFLRLIQRVPLEDIKDVWQEHRKPYSAENFSESVSELQRVITLRPDLIVAGEYSTNVKEVCLRCRETKTFPLANLTRIYSILGYV